MSDYDDRGAYTPPSDRLAFDPRTPVRGGGPAPVTLIISGLVLVGLVGGVFFLYREGFRHRGEAPALVGAPVAEVRTAAASAPPAAAPAAPVGLTVDKTTAPAPAPAFAPPPAEAMPPQGTTSALPPPVRVAPRAATPLIPVATPASPPVAKSAPPAPQVVTLAPDAPPEPAAPPPKKVVDIFAPRAAAPTERAVAQRPVVHHAAPITIASLTDDALARHARPARAMREGGETRDAALTSARFSEAMAPVAPPARHTVAARIKGAQFASTTPLPVADASAARVQIGAFSSPALADQGWRDLARAAPDAMAGKGKAVQPLDRDDGTTLYRTYVTGFATVSAAQAFCTELQASGKACMVK